MVGAFGGGFFDVRFGVGKVLCAFHHGAFLFWGADTGRNWLESLGTALNQSAWDNTYYKRSGGFARRGRDGISDACRVTAVRGCKVLGDRPGLASQSAFCSEHDSIRRGPF